MHSDPITSNELTAMLAAATPGPWRSLWNDPEAASEDYMGGIIVSGTEGAPVVLEMWWDGPRTACTEPNAALIAQAPTLAAEVLALRAALEAAGLAELEGGGYGSPRAGHEAEELRKGIENLNWGWEVDKDDLQRLLDEVDARDSLAYLEERAQAQAEIANLRARVAELEAVLAVLGVSDAP